MAQGPKNTKSRLKGWMTFAFILLLIFVIGSQVFAHYKNKFVNEKVEKLLPRICEKLGATITFDKVSPGLFGSSKITNFKVIVDTQKGQQTLVKIPSIRVEHTVRLEPQIHIELEKIILTKPELNLVVYPGKTTNLPEKWVLMIRGGGEKEKPDSGIKGKSRPSLIEKLEEYIDLSNGIEIVWEDGIATLEEGHFIADSTPFIVNLNESWGRAFFDIYNQSAFISASWQIEKKNGRVIVTGRADRKNVELILKGEDVSLSAFAPYLPSIVVPEDDARITGTLETKLVSGNPQRIIHYDGSIKGLCVNHWRLAKVPIRDIDFSSKGLLAWNKSDGYFEFPLMTIGQGDAIFDAQGRFDYKENKKVKITLTGRDVPIQAVLDAIPKDFVPKLYGAKVAGTLDLDFLFSVDMTNPNSLKLEPNVIVNDYFLVKSPPGADIKALKNPFKHTALKNGNVAKEFIVGPSNPDFVPYDRLGYWTIRGVLTCEDGRFFKHNGFQLRHIKASLIRNIKDKRFVRGGSTISMQLAKNLFLTGQKNLSRKFQEMLLTYAIEQELDKNRMLEIYMNIIEWGPKLYGIRPAAIHYFGKSPADLAPIEAAFLGSIIANPVRYHFMYSRGYVSDHWSVYLELIVRKMGAGSDKLSEIEPYKPEFGWVRRKRIAKEKEEKEELEKEKLLKLNDGKGQL